MARLQGHLLILLASLFLFLFAHSAPLDATPTVSRPLQSDRAESLTQRRAVIYGTGCATVPIVVPVLFFPVVSSCFFVCFDPKADSWLQTIIDGICLCTQAGVLVCPPGWRSGRGLIHEQTADSTARLDAQIQAGGLVPGVIRSVVPLVGGMTNLLGLAQYSATNAVGTLFLLCGCIALMCLQVNSRGSTCSYPANSTPMCSGGTTIPGTTCQFSKSATCFSDHLLTPS
jgi:hypothetical protein